MTIMLWNPVQEIEMLQKDMDRLVDVLIPNTTALTPKSRFNFVPAAEMTQSEDAIELKLEIPGLESENIEIVATEKSVTIKGERKSENKTEKESSSTKSEFRYGKFSRTIALPVLIDNTNVTAKYINGILQLNLPKAQAEKHKSVKVAVA